MLRVFITAEFGHALNVVVGGLGYGDDHDVFDGFARELKAISLFKQNLDPWWTLALLAELYHLFHLFLD